MSQRAGWPDPLILGQWVIVIPRGKAEELRREMEEKGPPVDIGLIGPLHPMQMEQVVLQIGMALRPPPAAGRVWRLLEPRWVN